MHIRESRLHPFFRFRRFSPSDSPQVLAREPDGKNSNGFLETANDSLCMLLPCDAAGASGDFRRGQEMSDDLIDVPATNEERIAAIDDIAASLAEDVGNLVNALSAALRHVAQVQSCLHELQEQVDELVQTGKRGV